MTINVCMPLAIHLHLYFCRNTNASKFYTQIELQENKLIFIYCDCYVLTLFKARLYPFLFFQSPGVMLCHLIVLQLYPQLVVVPLRQMMMRVVDMKTGGCSCATGALGALFLMMTGQQRLPNQNCIKYELNCQKIFLLNSILFNVSLH